ncbi:MAG: hypothetical protein A2117_02370 [Candidatus Wildermuthbacteria bacterium GWA2_46_15]|uniref:Uncharacterized protein n=1 Tax=Candidatus Wildermuthbacteria bacterium GWA2_46_15 TaxID=1802443 RepID=A0A1G2QN10_9BACT|nr:MAG: hypothetical protein A2117_02370 [Candidatus Wildermuthbacteria bacterium GWA2_46_15]
MDLFQALRELGEVEKVSHLYPEIVGAGPLDFFFFVCPARKSFEINRERTGFTTVYRNGITPASLERARKVRLFLEEFGKIGIQYNCRCVFSSADAIICFPIPVAKPEPPSAIEGIAVIENYPLLLANLGRWTSLICQKPWEKVSGKVREEEEKRLRLLFLFRPPENLAKDLIARIWAGFSLDGLLAREGTFGQNPVLLGVEGEGVTILQNAALSRKEWLPTIFLK